MNKLKTKSVVTNNEQWHSLRDGVITATEVGSIFGLNPYRSANKMWQEKKEKTFQGNAYTVVGQVMEPAVVAAVNHVTGEYFQLFEKHPDEKVFYTDPEIRVGATPDAYSEDRLLECKTCNPFSFIRYSYWPPRYYIIQLLTQLHCTEYKEGYLALLSTDMSPKGQYDELPIVIFKVQESEEFIFMLTKEVRRFLEAKEEGKDFRADSKIKMRLSLLLPMICRRIH